MDTKFLYVDPKADSSLAPAIMAMVQRDKLFHAECKRRGVRFLPKQVMRPVYEKAGLSAGKVLKESY